MKKYTLVLIGGALALSMVAGCNDRNGTNKNDRNNNNNMDNKNNNTYDNGGTDQKMNDGSRDYNTTEGTADETGTTR